MSASDPSEPSRSAAALKLVAEFNALKLAAEAEATAVADVYRRRNGPRFWPSRMTTKALAELSQVFDNAYGVAIEKRFAQLDRINKKLARSDPRWTLLTPEQIRALPKTYWRGGAL